MDLPIAGRSRRKIVIAIHSSQGRLPISPRMAMISSVRSMQWC